jgi:hypothetical protein
MFCEIGNLSFQCHEAGCTLGWYENIAKRKLLGRMAYWLGVC